MDLEAAFLARLLDNAQIAALVNKAAWGGVPQKTTLDYIVLTKAAAGHDWTHDGPDGLIRPWVQIDIYGATRPRAAALADVVQNEMERLDRVTVEGWHFDPPGLIVNDQWIGVEDLAGGGQAFRISRDYRFWAQEAVS